MQTRLNVLLLGGTTEANALADRFATARQFNAVLSLAGRTAAPRASPVPVRIGGFGGVEGLVDYLRDSKTDIVIDATHPFAAQMSRHAVAACAEAGVPLIAVERPPWQARQGDTWHNVASIADGVAALGMAPRRVFCAIGRLFLDALLVAPHHHYIVRLIDAPVDPIALPHLTTVTARGPFTLDADLALLRDHAIDVVFTKNSGGGATYSKIAAARELGLPIVMVERPALPRRATVATAEAAWAALMRLAHGAAADRGV